MKNGVECCKDFFPYFKALKTNCVLHQYMHVFLSGRRGLAFGAGGNIFGPDHNITFFPYYALFIKYYLDGTCKHCIYACLIF